MHATCSFQVTGWCVSPDDEAALADHLSGERETGVCEGEGGDGGDLVCPATRPFGPPPRGPELEGEGWTFVDHLEVPSASGTGGPIATPATRARRALATRCAVARDNSEGPTSAVTREQGIGGWGRRAHRAQHGGAPSSRRHEHGRQNAGKEWPPSTHVGDG